MPHHLCFFRRPVTSLAGAALAFLFSTPGAAQVAGQNATVAANQQSPVSLDTITVTGQYLQGTHADGQLGRAANLGLLGDLELREVPFNVTSYTAEYLENNQARTLADAVQGDPSVRVTTPSGSITDELSIRGFPVSPQSVKLNGIYGVAPYLRAPIESVERVEVFKGASALLGGVSEGAVGGNINLVSKRASDTPLTRISQSYASDSQFKTHLDVGRRFGAGNALGVRINAVYLDGDTAIDHQAREFGLASLGLDYRGDRLRASFDLIRQVDNTDAPNRWVFFATNDIPSPPKGTTNLLPDSYAYTRDTVALAQFEYDIADNVLLSAGLGRSRGKRDQMTGDPSDVDEHGNYSASHYYRNSSSTTYGGNIGIQAKFHLAGASHTLSARWDGTDREDEIGFQFGGSVSSNWNSIVSPPRPLNRITSWAPREDITLSSFALADSISFQDGRLIVIGGLRYQSIKSKSFAFLTGDVTARYDRSKVTPSIAASYKLTDNLSVYGNYIEALGLGQTAPEGTANYGQSFSPAISRQLEVGVKWDYNSWSATASVFQIKSPSAQTDPDTNLYGIDGQKRNRGAEFSASGDIFPNTRFLGGVAYTDAVLTKTQGGRADGNMAPEVPRWQFNVGLEWDFPGVPGLTLNGRAIHTGKQYIGNFEAASLPDWTRVDLGVRYKTQINSYPVTLRANIENVTNKNYWAGQWTGGYVYFGAPRTFLLSASIDL